MFQGREDCRDQEQAARPDGLRPGDPRQVSHPPDSRPVRDPAGQDPPAPGGERGAEEGGGEGGGEEEGEGGGEEEGDGGGGEPRHGRAGPRAGAAQEGQG